MQPSDCTIYAIRMANTPLRYQSEFHIQEMVAHACLLSENERQPLLNDHCLFDDDCPQSISHLNPWWGELTAIYALLQTNQSPFIGNAQYRRHWHDDHLKKLPLSSLTVSVPCMFNCSLAQQFMGGHQFPGIQMTMNLAAKNKLPFTTEEMEAIWNQPYFWGGPMAIGPWEYYKAYMEIIFDCLWPIWEAYAPWIQQIEGYDQRAMAFLSERLLTGVLLFHDKFLPRIPLHFIPQEFIGP